MSKHVHYDNCKVTTFTGIHLGKSTSKQLDLYNILCTVNTQYTSRQDAIITIRLYLATCFGRNWPSSGQLRTIIRYSKNSTQWGPISFKDGRLRPKHVAKYNLIVNTASCLDVCCVLTVHNILYKFDIHNVMASLKQSI